VIDIREILRRLHLGEPDRRIARDLGVSRNTVAHYRVWATRHGVLKRNALAGRVFRDVHDGNRHLLRWCVETAGRRIHGTTKRAPLEVFETLERAALRPLPLTPWELVEWKRAKLHADCHVVFAGAYYSAPHRLLGERLWVRATLSKVELFHDYALVATHRPARPGQRRTLTAHLPPDKIHFLLQQGLDELGARAADLGGLRPTPCGTPTCLWSSPSGICGASVARRPSP
jgi:Mu transposase, C-terminal domain